MNAVCKECKLNCDIEKYREMLNNSIVQKDYDFLDVEIIQLSKSLDGLIDRCFLCKKNYQVV